jgi:hypothetical protein
MTAPRILLAAGTAAAAVVSVAPAVGHSSAATANALRLGSASAATHVVVPRAAHVLREQVPVRTAVAAATRLTVVRASDGATLFTGSLATFRSLPVTPGTPLRVTVEKPARYAGLGTDVALRWS